jgi:hypothetical protein
VTWVEEPNPGASNKLTVVCAHLVFIEGLFTQTSKKQVLKMPLEPVERTSADI